MNKIFFFTKNIYTSKQTSMSDTLTDFYNDDTVSDVYKIFSPPIEDNSTEKWDWIAQNSTNFPNNTYWSQTKASQVIFPFAASDSYALPNKAYLQMEVQLLESGQTNSPTGYPAGTPIALASDLARTLCSQIQISVNGQMIENTCSERDVDLYVKTSLNYSYDYYVANRDASTDFVQISGPQQDQAVGYSGNQPNWIFSSTGLGGTSGTNTAGFVAPTGACGGYSLTIGATGTVGPATGLPVLFSGNFQPDTGNTSLSYNPAFWRNQALTDNGKTAYVRIPLSRMSDFCSGFDKVITADSMLFKFFPNQTEANMFVCSTAAVNMLGYTPVPKLYVVSCKLVMPYLTPRLNIATWLIQELNLAREQSIRYESYNTQTLTPWISGSSYSTTISTPQSGAEWLFLTMTPANYNASIFQDRYVSIPPPANSQGQVWTQAYCLLGGSNKFPTLSYGSLPEDAVRIYNTYLEAANRTNDELLAPLINYQVFNTSHYILAFDLRFKKQISLPSGTNLSITLQSINSLTANLPQTGVSGTLTNPYYNGGSSVGALMSATFLSNAEVLQKAASGKITLFWRG
jgi:hypothetical protein